MLTYRWTTILTSKNVWSDLLLMQPYFSVNTLFPVGGTNTHLVDQSDVLYTVT